MKKLTKQKKQCSECGRMRYLVRAHFFNDIEAAEKGRGGFYAYMCQECADAIPEFA